MPPSTGQIYQMTFQSTLQGQTIENVVHFQERTGASTQAQIVASAQTFFTFLSALLVNTQVLTAIIVKQMTPVAFDETIAIPTTATGANTSAVLTNMNSIVLTKRTGTAGKTHRGRMYVGGIPSVFTNDQNRLNTTGATACGTFTGNVMGAFGLAGTDTHLQIGVYSRAIGGSHPFTLAGFQGLTSIDTQLIFGTQRRRRIGVGI